MKNFISLFLVVCSTFLFNIISAPKNTIDYSLDSLIVTLTHEESMKFKDYNSNDFGIEAYATIECINGAYSRITYNLCNGLMDYKSEEQEKFFSKINPEYYYKILKINLFEQNADTLGFVEELLLSNPIVENVDKNYYINLNYNETFLNEKVYSQRSLQINVMESMKIIEARTAYNNSSTTSPVNVCILDSGVMSNHEDFNYIDLVNPLNNYCVVDVDNSYDFISNSSYTSEVVDSTNHGTAIAGIIAAIQNNDAGIDGICNKANIISYKVHQNDSEPGLISNCITAIDRALFYSEMNTIPIQLFNCSFNFYSYSNSLESAMRYYPGLFVCSAGNAYLDLEATPSYPACFDNPNILCVGALTNSGYLWIGESNYYDNIQDGSNYGTPVDFYALGSDVYSLSNTSTNSYGLFTGTSFACPYVTGAAALLISQGYDPYEAKQTLLNTKVNNLVSPSYKIVNIYSWSNTNLIHTHNLGHYNALSDLVLKHKSLYCSVCGLYYFSVVQTEISYTNTSHTFYCSMCENNYNDTHKYEYLDVGDAGHKKYCKHCQYYKIVNHIWQNYPFGGYICSICGHITGLIHD